MSNPRFPHQEKIVMEFPQLNDRQRIKNYSECDTPDEYLYHSISPFANSCFNIIHKTKYAMDRDKQGTQEALGKCLIGLNMNYITKTETMQKLICASNHVLLKGNLLENFREVNEKGLVNVSINITPEMLKQWLISGKITLGPITYQNLTYLGKGISDRIIFNK